MHELLQETVLHGHAVTAPDLPHALPPILHPCAQQQNSQSGTQADSQIEVCATAHTNQSIRRLVKSVVRGLKACQEPEKALDGMGGTYFFCNENGQKVAILKPCDEEPLAPNNPKVSDGATDWSCRGLWAVGASRFVASGIAAVACCGRGGICEHSSAAECLWPQALDSPSVQPRCPMRLRQQLQRHRLQLHAAHGRGGPSPGWQTSCC